MSEDKSPILTIDLKWNGGLVEFWTPDELADWIKKEETYWNWLLKVRQNISDPVINIIWTEQNRHYSLVRQQINNYISFQDEPQKKQTIGSIEKLLLDAYTLPQSLHSSTAAAKVVDSLRDADGIAATYALGYFLRKFVTPSREFKYSAIIGVVQAVLFDKGLSGVSENERKVIEELKLEHQSLIPRVKQQIIENDDLHDKADQALKARLKTDAEAFEKFMSESKSQIEEVTDTYDKKLALQSSVNYWTTKAKGHRDSSGKFTLLFVVSLIVLGIALILEVHGLLGNTGATKNWEYAVIAISALVFIWIIRIIVRVLLSHIHLERDAAERVTMLLTYIAMSREGHMPSEERRTLILQTLFRPSSSGIIKDDAIPASVLEVFTRSGSHQ